MEGQKILYKNQVFDALNKAVEKVYGHDLNHYMQRCRQREFVEVRQMAMYLYRQETGFSLHEIGKIFGKHHATIIFAIKQVEGLRSVDVAFSRDFSILQETFKKYL